jgi:hypothetical protein
MSKVTPKYNSRKRLRFNIYKDTPELDRDAENVPLPNTLWFLATPLKPISPSIRELRVL